MKNTIQIVEKSQCECDGWEESFFAKKKWYSKEEIKKAISKCYSYGHAEPLTEYYNNKDDNLICIAELEEHLFAPDLNSRSSDEDSLNKGYEVNQK